MTARHAVALGAVADVDDVPILVVVVVVGDEPRFGKLTHSSLSSPKGVEDVDSFGDTVY